MEEKSIRKNVMEEDYTLKPKRAFFIFFNNNFLMVMAVIE